jgi:2-oxoglutarate ferredoxin oxidoreductase subunit alpha
MFKGYRYHVTGLHHGPTGFPTEDEKMSQDLIERLINKVMMHTDEIESYEEYRMDDAEILIIGYGSLSRSAKEAVNRLRDEGIKVGLFRPITLWPSPAAKLHELGQRFEKILVSELNMGQYADEIERVMKRNFATLFKANGRPITPAEIIEKVKEL